MYNKIKLKEEVKIRLIFFLASIIIGSVCFLIIYGADSLNVTNDKWLLNAEDLNQHYIGWKFFRKGNWHFPLGLIDGITEYPISIIYTDSIPLFAIFFKLFSFLLPNTFQYFGLWGITCFILQTYFAMILLYAYIKDKFVVILGSIFFVLSPIVLMRMYVHSALGGNWLILAALSGWAHSKSIKGYKNNIITWCALMILAVCIHMYFIPIILAIMCSNYLNQFMVNKTKVVGKQSVVTICFSVVCALVTMLVLGAFYGEPNLLQGGVREFSSNLNTFYNPQGFSSFIKSYPLVSAGQWEGYAYLGIGIIILLVLGVAGSIKKKIVIGNKSSVVSLGILIFICGGYALSPRITWNDMILIDIPWPDVVIKVFSIFRATGRLIWPVYYIVFTVAIVLFVKVYTKKIIYIGLILLSIVQIIDIYPLIEVTAMRTKSDTMPSVIQSDVWEELKGEFDDIEFITSFSKVGDSNTIITNYFPMKVVFDIANYACDNKMEINDFYIGRRSGKLIEESKYSHWRQLLDGKVEERTLYIFNKIPFILCSNPKINIYECDGFFLGVSSNFKWKEEPKNKIDSTKINNILKYCFISNEEIKEGRYNIKPNEILYGPYMPVDKGKYKISVDGTNLNKGYLDVFSGDQNVVFKLTDLTLSAEKACFILELDNPVYDIEIRIKNESNENIEIKKMEIQKV